MPYRQITHFQPTDLMAIYLVIIEPELVARDVYRRVECSEAGVRQLVDRALLIQCIQVVYIVEMGFENDAVASIHRPLDLLGLPVKQVAERACFKDRKSVV